MELFWSQELCPLIQCILVKVFGFLIFLLPEVKMKITNKHSNKFPKKMLHLGNRYPNLRLE